MRSTTIRLIFSILLFTFHGAIDVRSSAQSLTMSSTTLASDLQVPSGQDVSTTNDALTTQTPFASISSSFGDINSWTLDMGPGHEHYQTMSSGSEDHPHEELFDEYLDTVQRVERQLAQVLAVWDKIARTPRTANHDLFKLYEQLEQEKRRA